MSDLNIPGLSPAALEGLSPDQILARLRAADERAAAIDRTVAGRRLAERVAATPPPAPASKKAPKKVPKKTPTSSASRSSDSKPERGTARGVPSPAPVGMEAIHVTPREKEALLKLIDSATRESETAARPTPKPLYAERQTF